MARESVERVPFFEEFVIEEIEQAAPCQSPYPPDCCISSGLDDDPEGEEEL